MLKTRLFQYMFKNVLHYGKERGNGSSGKLLKYLSFVNRNKASKYENWHIRLFNNVSIGLVGIGGSLIGIYSINKVITSQRQNILRAESKLKPEEEKVMSRREKRFHDFASYEYNNQIVMTPLDFIESLIENEPKLSRSSKIRLTEKNIKKILKSTPSIDQGSNTFFRDLHQNGIITYPEYLFLVTILTKSTVGLKTALKMMDVNGDKIITAEEFDTVVTMINKSATKRMSDEDLKSCHTTLLVHLFGHYGKDVVSFNRFFKFMDDLHSEVLELEFHEYSRSMRTISEIDFAKILLRNTTLTEQEYTGYIERLIERVQHPKGITLEQFKAFHSFLNNIEDFIITVNMTNVLQQPIDSELFTRSIKVTTGVDIDPYVIEVIFKLFDNDGDGKLSQNEFIGIMKDRLKRGFGKFPNVKGFAGFKRCLKKEMTRAD